MLLNIGFGLTIVAALLLLLIAAGASWFGDRLTSVGTVNGQTITRDDLNRQVGVNTFRADYQQRRLRTLLAAGQIRSADAENWIAVIQQRQAQNEALSLEQLIDGTVQADLAAKQGVIVTDADVDARFTEEATTPELRHAWMIEVKPELAEGATTPTDEAVAAARATAAQALADLKSGQDWETVAKDVSTDASKEQAGDISFIDENSALDPAFLAALMAAAKDSPTDVVEGADGSFRVGRVTEIIAPVVDATLAAQVGEDGVSMDDFRAALRRDVTRSKLSDAVLAQYLAPGPQRETSEILIEEGASESGPGAIRVRHILYSPNDDPNGAAQVAADDPAWATAKAAADDAFARIKADPALFDSIARAESDEGSAVTTGGKLPYFSTDDAIDPAFAAAVFQPGLQPGQLLDPVKSVFGWHVIQVMHGPTDEEWAARLKADIDAGTLPFADAARDNSDKAEAANGGQLGWIGQGQLDETREAAIFAAPIGKVSDPLIVPGEGLYLFLVAAEETREPDAAQKAALETSAFPLWYSKEKAAVEITRDPIVSGQATS